MPETPVPLVRLLAEGGVFEIFGRQTAEGQWLFVLRSFTMTDVDEWRAGGVPETADLGEVVPDIWPRLTPRLVHPELREWFRSRYAAAAQRSSAATHHRDKWQALFDATAPDRWSGGDEP